MAEVDVPPIPTNDSGNNNEDKSKEGDKDHEGDTKEEDTAAEKSQPKSENNTVENNGELGNNDTKTDEKLENVDEVDSANEHQTNVNNVENNETKDEETNHKVEETKETNEVSDNEPTKSEYTEISYKPELDDNTKLIEDDKNPEEMEPDELRRKISECKLKYDTLQIELDMVHAKNIELEDKMKTMSESRKKSSESMSSTEAREKAKQRDGLAFQANYLARELNQQQNTEAYLREKLTETLEEKEDMEKKNKDLQLRLKRFTKDDQAKDERIARMEKELYDINMEVQEMEKLVDQSSLVKIHEMRQSKSSSAPNGDSLPQTGQTSIGRQQTTSSPTSKTCTIL